MAFGAITPSAQVQDDYNRTLDRQEKERQELERIQKQKELEKSPSKIELPEQQEKPVTPEVSGAACFELQNIVIEDATLLSAKKQKKLLDPYIHKCLSSQEINNIISSITNWYVSNGYVTVRVYIPEQNIKTGILKLKVIEGVVERVRQNDDKFRDKMEMFTAFPIKKNKKLNLRDMEQGLDQLNKLPSNSAQTKILPGSTVGSSIIQVTNNQSDKLRAYLDISNTLNVKGQPKLNARVEKDNLFHLNEQFQYSYGTGLVRNNDDVSRNHGISFSMPMGYWTIRSSYYYFRSLTNINLSGNKYPYDNYTNNINLGADYVLYRWKSAIVSLTSNLSFKDRDTYFSGQYLETLSRRSSNLDLGVDFTNKYSSGYYNFRFTLVHGTKFFGAKHDVAEQVGPQYPKGQFRKYLIDGSICHYFKLGMKYCSNGRIQFSENTLYSEEQIGIGDRYTVRGFNKGFFLGDNGFYVRNELSLPFYYRGQNVIVRNIWSPEIFVGLDFGFSAKKGPSDMYAGMDNVWISGFAFGVKNTAKYLNLSLTAAFPLMQPRFIYAVEGKNIEIYANLTLKIF